MEKRGINYILTIILLAALCSPLNLLAKGRVITIWTSSENVKRAIDQITPLFTQDYQVRVEVSVLNN